MIKIVICCGGGFSSSALATKMQKELVEKNLADKFNISFRPFGLLKKELTDCDVAMLCPHLLHDARKFVSDNTVDFPIYMIPTRIYGLMSAETIVEDAEDIIEVFSKNKKNIACFEGEDNPLTNHRIVSHRRIKK